MPLLGTFGSGSSKSFGLSSATRPDAPVLGTPVAVGPGQISIPFTAPASNGKSTINSYTVVADPGGQTSTLNQSGSGRFTLSGLTVGAFYQIKLYATNNMGTSTYSAVSSPTAAALVPGTPTSIRAVAVTPHLTTVSFTAPASDGGLAITSYTAVSSPGGITASVSQAGSGFINVPGLSNGTAYTFNVYATNSLGNSTNATTNSVTQSLTPGITVTLNAGGTGSVTATWTNFTTGTPTSYQVLVDGVVQTTVSVLTATVTISSGADRVLTIAAYNGSTYMASAAIRIRFFAYTGGQQTWTVPTATSFVMTDVLGAQGGSTGGQGGRTKTYVTTTPGETLYMYVGGQGTTGYRSACGGNPGVLAGGFNGGGAGGSCSDSYGCGSGMAYALGPGGGGASDIRQGGNALANRVIVSGGGGGGSYPNSSCGGTPATVSQGAGYNTTAGDGGVTGQGACGGGWPFGAQGRAASTSAGGAAGTGAVYNGLAGSLGQGGNCGTGNVYGDAPGNGGGGGGGYYGGGGSGCNSNYGSAGSGGGGSGYLSSGLTGYFSYGTSSAGYNTGHGQILITW